MADWDKISSRGHVDDRRGMSPVSIGGVSVTGILLLMGVTYLMGGNPLEVLQEVDINQLTAPQQAPIDTSEFEGADSYEVFASTVLGSINDYWAKVLKNTATPYQEPELVLFRGFTTSGCSGANSASGPHYCPADNTIYLDETFFAQLTTNFGAKGGDVAEAYVIAHEVGHHIQNLMGALNTNRDSIKIELQADCYAGAWAGSLRDQGIFELNEITEAMDAASAVGDDNIQNKTAGEVHPEAWTHGSSKDRVIALKTGYDNADFRSCNIY
jgi:hypothetical protein